jgi:thioredoxin reductase
MNENYDVVVVGGGAAGLAGAVALARSRRSVLVIDSGEPRNAPASHVHNFLTRDGTPPAQIYAAGREEVAKYGGQVVTGRVSALRRDGEQFRVKVGQREAGEREVTARRLLIATGLRDELPQVPGLAARWGIDVLHCPYCHGWEVLDQRIGILATGPGAAHQALLFRQLSPHVTVLRHTAPELTPEQREQFAALGIAVVEGTVTRVEAGDSGLTGVSLADGTSVPLDALIVAPLMTANAELLRPLGLVPAEVRVDGQVIGTQVEAGPSGATSVPGVWVAGNLAGVQAQVITAAAAGLTAGAAINADLAAEDARRATHRRSAAELFTQPLSQVNHGVAGSRALSGGS